MAADERTLICGRDCIECCQRSHSSLYGWKIESGLTSFAAQFLLGRGLCRGLYDLSGAGDRSTGP